MSETTRDITDPALAALLERAGGGGAVPRPVERWHPAHCGILDMRIARDGTWFHEGRPIARPALVALFASILRREADGAFVLVTPAEKMTIAVEDAPFVAVELHVAGQGRDRRLTLRTNVGDVVVAGPDHPLRFAEEAETGGLKPYIRVRGGLEALASRAVAMELAALALADEGQEAPGQQEAPDGAGCTGVWSDGVFFALPQPA